MGANKITGAWRSECLKVSAWGHVLNCARLDRVKLQPVFFGIRGRLRIRVVSNAKKAS